jgi:molybdopterin molybdotransferase
VLPEDADCVVRFEDTDEPGEKNGPNPAHPREVKIFVSLPSGANVNKAGANTRKGSLVVPKGTVVGPAQLSALTAVGKTQVKVVRRPVVAVITTGDELVQPGKPLSPGKAYDCNGVAIKALITHNGGIPRVLGMTRDREAAITAKILKGLAADAIVTSGGVSRGDYDLVRLVLGKLGEVVFSRIQMGPGASFAFGLCRRKSVGGGNITTPVFALSGPPAGCLNNFETLVRPALLKMRGLTTLSHSTVEAYAEDSVSGKKPMSFIQWTYLEKTGQEYHVRLNNLEGLFNSLATANSLTIIPAGIEVKAGEKIPVWPLDWNR